MPPGNIHHRRCHLGEAGLIGEAGIPARASPPKPALACSYENEPGCPAAFPATNSHQSWIMQRPGARSRQAIRTIIETESYLPDKQLVADANSNGPRAVLARSGKCASWARRYSGAARITRAANRDSSRSGGSVKRLISSAATCPPTLGSVPIDAAVYCGGGGWVSRAPRQGQVPVWLALRVCPNLFMRRMNALSPPGHPTWKWSHPGRMTAGPF
jgi:hypothetical protein